MRTSDPRLSALVVAALAVAPFPREACAALARVPGTIAPSVRLALPSAPSPTAALAPALSPGLAVPPGALAPSPSAARAAVSIEAPAPAEAAARTTAEELSREEPSDPAGAAAADDDSRRPLEPVAAASGALFDGLAAAADAPLDPGTPPSAGASAPAPSLSRRAPPARESRRERVPGPHSPSEKPQTAALKSSIAVGALFAALEFAGGVLTGTLALKADALHLLSDRVLDAGVLLAAWIARRPPTARRPYGWLKAEAAIPFAGALALAAMSLAMIPAAVEAFLHPAAAAGWSVLGYAALSMVSNLISAALLQPHHEGHIGIHGVFLHALTDALGTFAVMVAAAASLLWGWTFLMPLATAASVLILLFVSWELGRPALDVLLDAAPAGVDVERLGADLAAVPGIESVRDLRVRALSSADAELVAKAYAKPGADAAAVLAAAHALLRERYGVSQATIQLEPAPRATP